MKPKCEKCGTVDKFRVEEIDKGKSATCAICGKVHYKFDKPEDFSLRKRVRQERRPMRLKVRKCLCHTVLGGGPCRRRFRSAAGNALYHPKCRRAVLRKQVAAYCKNRTDRIPRGL